MIRTHNDVPKRARNSITIQMSKLVKKYGEKPVRLVAMKYLGKLQEQRLIEKTIAIKEEELRRLKKK